MNRREDIRIRCEHKAVLKVLSVPGMRRPPKIKIACRTTDVSWHGARLTLVANKIAPFTRVLNQRQTLIPEGTIAKVRITFKRPHKTFVHVGTVRWVKQETGEPVMVIGFELTDSSPRVLKSWQKFLTARFAPGAR